MMMTSRMVFFTRLLSAMILMGPIHVCNSQSSSSLHHEMSCDISQVHLAYGHKPESEMTVSFATPFQCNLNEVQTVVMYWENNNDEVASVGKDEEVKQYNSSSCDYEGLRYVSPFFHHVRLKNLKPETEYSYKILLLPKSKIPMLNSFVTNTRRLRGERSFIITSTDIYNFKTTSPLGSGYNQKIAVFADYGQSDRAQSVQNFLMEDNDIEMIMIGGDIAYANSNNTLWDNWFEMMEPMVSKIPLMVAPGNHEIETDNVTFSIFEPYENRFACPKIANVIVVPQKPSAQDECVHPGEFIGTYDYGNSFYSFSAGPTVFMFLNPYTFSNESSRQYEFISEVLKNIDRNVTPWVVAVFHCPWYNTFNSHINESQTMLMKQSIEPLFVKYKVNLVFSGHTHGFSRSKSVAFNKVDEDRKSPIYITIGDSGQKDKPELYQSVNPEEWIDARDGTDISFGTIEALNSTHLLWYRVHGINGTVLEEVYIENQYFR